MKPQLHRRRWLGLLGLALSAGMAWAEPQGAGAAEQTLLRWHQAALDATGLDHTPPAAGETRGWREQLGPLRASRAMAIVHLAMADAVLAHTGGYQSYTRLASPPAGQPLSVAAALAQAAHDSLSALFPAQSERLSQLLAQELVGLREPAEQLSAGRALGRAAAAAILSERANDGAQHPEPRYGIDYIASNAPGEWRQDPLTRLPIALGAEWGRRVKPFALRSADQFRLPPPPRFDSQAFARSYEQVRALGGDGQHTATLRSQGQTQMGIFWAYDGVPTLCAPTRLYNQVALQVDLENPRFQDQQALRWRSAEMAALRPLVQRLRYLALANVAMADAGLAAWDSKYVYKLGRPVTVIREGIPGSGLVSDPGFTPLGAPASNLAGPNFTPPFPAYPSGHAAFGGALFEVLRKLKGGEHQPFTFVSDELNGLTRDNQGNLRPYAPRHYSRLSQPEFENGASRIYLGIHWDFDATEGTRQGNQVAQHVLATVLRPLLRP